jgi:hypothetical protein
VSGDDSPERFGCHAHIRYLGRHSDHE